MNITETEIFDLLTFGKVRVPAERIKMYTEFSVEPNEFQQYPEGFHKTSGPDDIALVKLRESVTLIPGRIAPVGEVLTSPVNTCLQACLDHQGKIQDTETAAVVQGCSNINLFEMQ